MTFIELKQSLSDYRAKCHVFADAHPGQGMLGYRTPEGQATWFERKLAAAGMKPTIERMTSGAAVKVWNLADGRFSGVVYAAHSHRSDDELTSPDYAISGWSFQPAADA